MADKKNVSITLHSFVSVFKHIKDGMVISDLVRQVEDTSAMTVYRVIKFSEVNGLIELTNVNYNSKIKLTGIGKEVMPVVKLDWWWKYED